jgi:hypothetical protein
MPSSYSPDLRIELIANGEKTGTWGTITNDNLGVIIEDAISGLASVSVTTADQALTAQNGAADQSRCAAVSLTTTTGAPFNVYVPPVTKLYVIQNASSFTATVYASTVLGNTTAAGSGTAIPAGRSVLVRCDGTNVFDQFNHVVNNMSFGGNISVAGDASVTGNVSITGTTTLVGAATAPTPSNTDDSTKIATTAFVRDIIPSGLISMWSGTIATIPSGWLLCNGSSGTPDLRDRFVIGANADDAGVAKTNITGSPTQTGGSKDAIVVSHTHSFSGTTNTASLSGTLVASKPPSASGIVSVTATGVAGGGDGSQSSATQYTINASHSHTVSGTTGSAGSSGTNANLVPYFALAFIMKA